MLANFLACQGVVTCELANWSTTLCLARLRTTSASVACVWANYSARWLVASHLTFLSVDGRFTHTSCLTPWCFAFWLACLVALLFHAFPVARRCALLLGALWIHGLHEVVCISRIIACRLLRTRSSCRCLLATYHAIAIPVKVIEVRLHAARRMPSSPQVNSDRSRSRCI